MPVPLPDPKRGQKYFEDKVAFTTGPVELARAIERNEVNVIDVRSAEDFQASHIPSSKSLPKDRWDSAEGLVRDKPNVVLCYSQVCHLAANACVRFAGMGFPVMELEGGFRAWREHKLPTQGKATGEEGRNGGAAGAEDGERVTELRRQVYEGISDLRAMRDEIRLRIQEAGEDLKGAWRELEPRLERSEREVKDAAGAALLRCRDAVAELRAGFRSVLERL